MTAEPLCRLQIVDCRFAPPASQSSISNRQSPIVKSVCISSAIYGKYPIAEDPGHPMIVRR